MKADSISGVYATQCHNCKRPSLSVFCSDWCADTYLARRDAHRAVGPQRMPPQTNECSVLKGGLTSSAR